MPRIYCANKYIYYVVADMKTVFSWRQRLGTFCLEHKCWKYLMPSPSLAVSQTGLQPIYVYYRFIWCFHKPLFRRKNNVENVTKALMINNVLFFSSKNSKRISKNNLHWNEKQICTFGGSKTGKCSVFSLHNCTQINWLNSFNTTQESKYCPSSSAECFKDFNPQRTFI